MNGPARAVALAFTLLPALLGGQEASQALELDDFRLAAPPALTLAGVAPASVERPNTPRALIASLVSATGSNGVVPNGFAMETAPYWLSRHPALELRDYFHPSLADRLRYFTALSAATSRPRAVRDSISPDAIVSIAMRTLLASGRPSPALLGVSDAMRKAQLQYISVYRRWEQAGPQAASLDASRKRLAREDALLSTLVTRVTAGGERELRDSTLRTLARRDSARVAVARSENAAGDMTRFEKEMDSIDERLSGLAKRFAEEDMDPDGFTLEVAAGTRARFIEGKWGRERVDGVGVWVTPMYRLSSRHLEVIGVARYLTRVADYDNDDVLDAGARVGRDIGRAQLAAEWSNRSLRGDGATRNSSRWAAIFSVPLPAKLQLQGSFGSDFRRRDGTRPVIATLGINLGVGAIELAPAR